MGVARALSVGNEEAGVDKTMTETVIFVGVAHTEQEISGESDYSREIGGGSKVSPDGD